MHKELFITSSLPRIYWEDITTENLAYKNQPCLIKSNLLKGAKKSKKNIFEIFLDNNKVLYLHTK